MSANRVVCTCGWVAPAASNGPGPVVELMRHHLDAHRERYVPVEQPERRAG